MLQPTTRRRVHSQTASTIQNKRNKPEGKSFTLERKEKESEVLFFPGSSQQMPQVISKQLQFFLSEEDRGSYVLVSKNSKKIVYRFRPSQTSFKIPAGQNIQQILTPFAGDSNNSSNLNQLDCNNYSHLTNGDLKFIVTSFSKLKLLKLNLTKCTITKEGFAQLADLTLLNDLELHRDYADGSNDELTDDWLEPLTRVPLTYLNLIECNQITKEGLSYLVSRCRMVQQ